MQAFSSIKNLYLPVQPTVKQSGTNVLYREVVPAELLRNCIYCYWELKTIKRLQENFVYRVVSDGCIDIFFELTRPSESFVMGFCKKFTEFTLDTTFHYVGIRFLPTMFPQVFKIDASELSNRYVDLSDIHRHTSAFLRDRMEDNLSFEQIKELFDSYFFDLVNNSDFNADPRLYRSLDMILKKRGVLQVNEELDFGISQRQLRRLFNYYIGDTPKTFSKVVRFQNILRAKPSVQSLKKSKLFYDVGYYDQAHFIKEFKNHYGVTPTKAFGR